MQVPPSVYYDASGENFRHQLTRAPMGAAFWKEWHPHVQLFPSQPAGEKVKRCKKCPEPALQTGRQECAAHRAERTGKAKAAAEFRASLPRCSTEGCKEPAEYKRTPEGAKQVHSFCLGCQAAQQTAAAKQTREEQLYSAVTVEDLREWIIKYQL